MQLLRRVLAPLALLAPLAAGAAEVRIEVHGKDAWWLLLPAALVLVEPPRPAPPVSPHHLGPAPQPAADSCKFVAGVRHCPLPKPRAEPR